MSTKKIIIICVVILLFGAGITWWIFSTEPTAKSEGATRKTAMLVEVAEVESGDFIPMIAATGTVQPVEDVMLSPQVAGQIISRTPEFTPGGFVKKGAILLQIDPSDYRNTLELRRSDLLQAQTNLEMEMGRQEVAQQDLQLIGIDTLSANERDLVLRQPQLEAVRATIQAARAAVEQAELNLARTTIRAPFDAHILTQNVTVGSMVGPGDELGRLVGSKNYWVILTVPVSQLQWLEFPRGDDERGSVAKIRNAGAWPEEVYREGYLDKQVGALDAQTRLARVLVRVPDPLARNAQEEEKPELMIGTFVEAELEGKEIKNVVRIHRDFVRNNQTVWVMENGKLSIREVKIVLSDAEYAYISEGLNDKEQVVTTNLSTVAEGLDLRTDTNGPGSGNKPAEGLEPEE